MAETREHVPPYEAPRIERVLTLADLDREILYAGDSISADGS
jgi:hypothetical protein